MNKLALRGYLGCLLAKRFTLKWYMQSGRSRTGKLQSTRYGLLAYLAEAVERGPRRGRPPRAGVDHLRPASRGVGDGG
jgi:glycerol-3-phosphate O-acyltransferase